jgi:hypothetical protein
MPLNCGFVEPMTGIEPAYSAWEADASDSRRCRQNCRQSPKRAAPDAKKASDLCAPEEIRTPNLLIRSQMLYPLSYGRMCSVI